MAIRVEIKRLILKGIWRSAQANSLALAQAIGAALDARYEQVSDGSIIASTSGSGYSVSYSTPSGSGISPIDVAEAVSYLDDLHSLAVAKYPSGTDTEKYTWMLAQLQKVRSFSTMVREVRL